MLPDGSNWWEDPHLRTRLFSALDHINDARIESPERPLAACRCLLDGLNVLYGAFHYWSTELHGNPDAGGQDARRLTALLLALPETRKYRENGPLYGFAALEPSMMDQSVLEKLGNPWADAADVPEDVRRRAMDAHGRFKRAFRRYQKGEGRYDTLLRRLASAIAVFRNNLQHGEKARRLRDIQVAEVIRPVLEETMELVLDYPSRRLATYGTLTDDAAFREVTGIVPARCPAVVIGIVDRRERYQFFQPIGAAKAPVSIAIFEPERSTYQKLDHYEGTKYHRMLIAAQVDRRIEVCNIYAASESRP